MNVYGSLVTLCLLCKKNKTYLEEHRVYLNNKENKTIRHSPDKELHGSYIYIHLHEEIASKL